MCLVEPSRGAPISGVQVPGEFYWVLTSPAPLAGMQYPRADFPWSQVKRAGFSRVVSLQPGKYHPAPLTVLFAERLEDLAHGGPPHSAGTETEAVKRAVVATVSSLRAGEGVVIHCEGGCGRTGTVLACVLRELGYEGGVVVDYLDRVHKARGKPGWPESPWQGDLVRDWKPDSRPPAAAVGAWHALLAPLPPDAVPLRKAVGSPEILATPHGASIAGWEQLTVDLSAGTAGLRVVLVVLDAGGRPISASDAVLHRVESPMTHEPAHVRQESIGGRIEPDGTFQGTCWHTAGPEPPGDEEPQWEMQRSEPSSNQISALMALVAEMVRRAPPRE